MRWSGICHGDRSIGERPYCMGFNSIGAPVPHGLGGKDRNADDAIPSRKDDCNCTKRDVGQGMGGGRRASEMRSTTGVPAGRMVWPFCTRSTASGAGDSAPARTVWPEIGWSMRTGRDVPGRSEVCCAINVMGASATSTTVIANLRNTETPVLRLVGSSIVPSCESKM